MPPTSDFIKKKSKKSSWLVDGTPDWKNKEEEEEQQQRGEHDKNDEVVRENWGGSVEWWMRLNHSTGWELMDFQVRAQW